VNVGVLGLAALAGWKAVPTIAAVLVSIRIESRIVVAFLDSSRIGFIEGPSTVDGKIIIVPHMDNFETRNYRNAIYQNDIV
jgi:hypothetical protein